MNFNSTTTTMKLDFYEEYDKQHIYRLIELPEQIIGELQEEEEEYKKSQQLQHYSLTLRGKDRLVLCNKNTTWNVKQRSQSNTLHLVETRDDGLASICITQPILECTLSESPQLDTSDLPSYDGDSIMGDSHIAKHDLDTLKSRSSMSGVQFDQVWAQIAGVEIDGVACVVADSLIKETIDDILTSLASQKQQLNLVSASDVVSDTSPAVVTAVLKMFATTPIEPYNLDLTRIISWIGRNALGKPVRIEQFMIMWKNSIPMIIDDDMVTLDLIKGSYALCETMIHKLSESDLPRDPKERFARLFQIKDKWELDEMAPFIEPIKANKSTKTENFVLKYAKKRKIAGKVMVCRE